MSMRVIKTFRTFFLHLLIQQCSSFLKRKNRGHHSKWICVLQQYLARSSRECCNKKEIRFCPPQHLKHELDMVAVSIAHYAKESYKNNSFSYKNQIRNSCLKVEEPVILGAKKVKNPFFQAPKKSKTVIFVTKKIKNRVFLVPKTVKTVILGANM